MTETELLLSRIEDRIRMSETQCRMTSTGFLSLQERSEAAAFCRRRGVRHSFYGGYPDAERTVLLLLPDSMAPTEDFTPPEEENPLCLLRCTVPRVAPALSHRDYLGSLLALGIKREVVGDILVFPDGADIVVLESIAPFLTEHYESAGRVSLACAHMEMSQIRAPLSRTETVCESVASLRLDNLVGAVFGVSRTDAAAAILRGSVFVNDIEAKKPDARLEPGDKLVLRGAGKAVFSEIAGTTRKGRLSVRFQKYK